MFIDKVNISKEEISIYKKSNPMKTRKIIAVGGSPGTGKTTLFRKYGKQSIPTN